MSDLVLPDGRRKIECPGCGRWWFNSVAPGKVLCGGCSARDERVSKAILQEAKDEHRRQNEISDEDIRSITTEEERFWKFPYAEKRWV